MLPIDEATERVYDDPEVDAYYKQIQKNIEGIETPLQGIGALLLVFLIFLVLVLNIRFLLTNRGA